MADNELYYTTTIVDFSQNNNNTIHNVAATTSVITNTAGNVVSQTSRAGIVASVSVGGIIGEHASDNIVVVGDHSDTAASIIRESSDHDLIMNNGGRLFLLILFVLVILITLVGNTLVIVAVITTRRLRTVTNCFVTSLAVADLLVAMFVMPPAVALFLMGHWTLGSILCDVWISLDVLLCTASILSLCAISVDRYLAVTQPLNYSRRHRSKRLAFVMIIVVWCAAFCITCPPIFGWYDPNRLQEKDCHYNRNEGYVIFSAMGSFFLPMIVMLYVYVRISCVVAQRHDQLANIETRPSIKKQKLLIREESDVDRGCSECDEASRLPVRCSSTSSADTYSTTFGGQSRSIRSNYSFPSVQRPGSVYNNPMNIVNMKNNAISRSQPESFNLEASALNLQPSNRVSSFRRETKTTQTLSIVVGGFIACWLPFFIYYLVTPFINTSDKLMTFLTWLGWINSAINPFIYAFYSPDFRLAFWKLTFKHCSNDHRTTNFAFQNK